MNQDIRYYHDSISEWNSKYTRIWHAFRSSTLNSLVTLFRYFKFITEQIVLKVPKHGTYIFRWLYTVNPLPRILKVYSIVLLFVRVNFPTRHNTAKFSVENFALKNCFRNCLYRRRDGMFAGRMGRFPSQGLHENVSTRDDFHPGQFAKSA